MGVAARQGLGLYSGEAVSAPTREEFKGLVGTYEALAYDHGYCEGCASYDDEGLSGAKRTAGRAESRVKATGAALLAAYDAIAAERDAALKERNLFEQITKGAMLKPTLINGVGGFEVLPVQPDPRIAAWRALDAEERDETLSAMRINGYDAIEDKQDAAASRIGRASLIAAAALEALGEGRP